jgi:serine/threonine protein kinase
MLPAVASYTIAGLDRADGEVAGRTRNQPLLRSKCHRPCCLNRPRQRARSSALPNHTPCPCNNARMENLLQPSLGLRVFRYASQRLKVATMPLHAKLFCPASSKTNHPISLHFVRTHSAARLSSAEPWPASPRNGRFVHPSIQISGNISHTAAGCDLAGAVFHGDVKPANVLVSHDGRLQVADPLGSVRTSSIPLSSHPRSTGQTFDGLIPSSPFMISIEETGNLECPREIKPYIPKDLSTGNTSTITGNNRA